MLETERLFLRPWTEADAPECFRYARDPRVGPPCGWTPHPDVEHTKRIIRTVLSDPETYAIVLKKTGLPVGSISLMRNTSLASLDDEVELGYWLGVPYWGQGIVPEAARVLLRRAFTALGVSGVWCGYADGNEKSRRVQQKLGFRDQWTADSVRFPQTGEERTEHVSLLTREDWERQSAARVRISVKRVARYGDLITEYENPIEHPCEMREGMTFVSVGGERPEGFCDSAWDTIAPFVRELAAGGGHFYGDWMRDPRSAMLSCNDGFRPVSFLLEIPEGES